PSRADLAPPDCRRKRFLRGAGKQMRERQQVEPDEVLGVVRIQRQPTLERRYRLGGISPKQMSHTQHQMTESKAWTDLNGLFGGKHCLLRSIGICATDRERIVRVRVSFIEPNGPQTGIKAFLDVMRRIVSPAISHDSGANTAKPGVRL